MNYYLHILIMLNIYLILVVSTNLLVGMTGMLSLGQGALYGIGAYIGVLAIMVLNLPLIPAILLVMISTALISFLIAYPSIRLKGDYFVIATLGFQLIIYNILYNWTSVTRGPFGIPGIPAPKLFGMFKISGINSFLILSTILAAITVLILYKMINSPYGRVLKCMRDDETALTSLGRNVNTFKIWTFIVSSSFIGISGLIYASYVSYIDPTSFNLDEALFIVSALLIGGTGNIKGPVAGAVFVVLLPEILRFVGLPDSIAANMRQIIYGASLIILMRYRPQGIIGIYRMK
jgi:branched-chain amino acid transport system permease protein